MLIIIIMAFVSIDTEAQQRPKKPFEPSAFSTDIRLGYMAGKIELTDHALLNLENYLVDGHFFSLLRSVRAENAPGQVKYYQEIFYEAEDSTDVPTLRGQGVCFTESYGDSLAYNKFSGAAGVAQFMKSTGARYGLPITYKIVLRKNSEGRFYKQRVIDKDYRYDPEKSILAACQYLSDMANICGPGPKDAVALDFASAGYHMGEGNLFQVIGLAVAQLEGGEAPKINSRNASYYIEEYGLSWSKIYFMAMPGTPLYRKLFSLKDQSATYLFRVKSAEKLLVLNEREYARVYEATRDGILDSIERVPALFISWYSADSSRFAEYADPTEAQGFIILLNGLFRKVAGGNFQPMEIREITGPFIKVDFFKEPEAKTYFEFMLKRLYGFGFLSYLKMKDHYLIAAPPDEATRKMLSLAWDEAQEYMSRK